MKDIITVYHGGTDRIEYPQVNKGRMDIDFGAGFYTIEDKHMSEKWACSKASSFVNKYTINLSDAKIKYFSADKEWLEFISYNRRGYSDAISFSPTDYDIIIGPTADDRLFSSLDLFFDE